MGFVGNIRPIAVVEKTTSVGKPVKSGSKKVCATQSGKAYHAFFVFAVTFAGFSDLPMPGASEMAQGVSEMARISNLHVVDGVKSSYTQETLPVVPIAVMFHVTASVKGKNGT